MILNVIWLGQNKTSLIEPEKEKEKEKKKEKRKKKEGRA